jgi:hypothetical protein
VKLLRDFTQARKREHLVHIDRRSHRYRCLPVVDEEYGLVDRATQNQRDLRPRLTDWWSAGKSYSPPGIAYPQQADVC